MVAVTEKQLEDAARDADDFAEIVNGPETGEVQTRYGGRVSTVKRLLLQIRSQASADTIVAAAEQVLQAYDDILPLDLMFNIRRNVSDDQTQQLQEACDYSAAMGVPLVLKGLGPIYHTGLVLKSKTWLECRGTTQLRLLSGSNKPALRNENELFYPSIPVDEQITVISDLPIDCNAEGQNDTGTDGVWLAGVRFTGVNGLQHDFDVLHPRRFAYWLINVKDPFSTKPIKAIHVEEEIAGNTDGYHMNGGTTGVWVPKFTNVRGNDDSVAFNCNESAALPFGAPFTPENLAGPISGWFGNIHHEGCFQGVRWLAAADRLYDVHIESITGDIKNYALNVQDYDAGTGGSYEGCSIDLIDVTVKPFAGGVLPIVGINTQQTGPAAERYSTIRIGSFIRRQETGAGDDRDSFTFLGRRTHLNIGYVEERNANNKIIARITGGGPGTSNGSIIVGKVCRPGSRVSPDYLLFVTATQGTLNGCEVGKYDSNRPIAKAAVHVHFSGVPSVVVRGASPLDYAAGAFPLILYAMQTVTTLHMPEGRGDWRSLQTYATPSNDALAPDVIPPRLTGPASAYPAYPVAMQTYGLRETTNVPAKPMVYDGQQWRALAFAV